MQTRSGNPSRCAPGVLLLGPGARLARLAVHLRSCAGPDGPRPVAALEDLGQLFGEHPRAGRLVLDADALAVEDVKLVTSFLTHRPAWTLALVGSDAGAGAPRRLLASAGARWLPWPLDLDQLEELARIEGPAEPDGDEPAPAAGPREEPATRLDPALRQEIERILGPAPAAARRAAEPAPTPVSAPARSGGTPTATAAPAARPAAPATQAPPAWYRAQVADLADIAQRVELAASMARERASEPGATPSAELSRKHEELALEALRLVQFTRTLGYLVAPPPRGEQRIELAQMAEELLSQVGREPGAPRYLFRSDGPLWVRADKGLLAQALDALIYLAHHCAGPQGTVHVEGRSRGGGASAAIELSVRFPAGPLAGMAPDAALEPYALRRALPELGPNALAAARGIVRGQGGELTLEPAGEERLRWLLALPGLDAATF